MSQVMVGAPVVPIRLEIPCAASASAACDEFARPLLEQLQTPHYSLGCSLQEIADLETWIATHRTARKRRGRALARGYTFAKFDREAYVDEIHIINMSLGERQGRPMTDGYRVPPSFAPLGEQCERHAINCYGVFCPDARLVAYTFVYRAGELALISQILGHGDHLAAEIMYLLVAGAYDAEADQGGWLYYNRHDSGTAGLVFFKERLGFTQRDIAWEA